MMTSITKFLGLFLLALSFSGCAVYRVENPKLAAPVRDITRAEIVGWKTPYKGLSGPDRAVPIQVDSEKFDNDAIDISETIHALRPGERLITVMFFGVRGNVVPKVFAAYAEIPLRAEAGVRYQCRGSVEADVAVLWIVRLPEEKRVTDEWEATIGDIGFSGRWKPRTGS